MTAQPKDAHRGEEMTPEETAEAAKVLERKALGTTTSEAMPAAIMQGLRPTIEVTLSNGMRLTVREPDAMATVRLGRALGEDASNPLLSAIYTSIVSIEAVNGNPVGKSTRLEMDVLLQGLGRMSIVNEMVAKVSAALGQLIGLPETELRPADAGPDVGIDQALRVTRAQTAEADALKKESRTP